MKKIMFWVYESKSRKGNFAWLFEGSIATIQDLDKVAERIDRIAREAWYFEPEEPLDRELVEKLIRAVRSEKSKLLLAKMLA